MSGLQLLSVVETQDPRHIHQRVKAAVMRNALCNTGLHTGFVAHITHPGCGLTSGTDNFCNRGLQRLRIQVHAEYRTALRRYPCSTRFTNATAGAGNQNHFIFESLHRASPITEATACNSAPAAVNKRSTRQ